MFNWFNWRKKPQVAVIVSDPIKITVDHSMTLDEMEAAGQYGFSSYGITPEPFPIVKSKDSEVVEVYLIRFGTEVRIREILAELDKRGLRPAILTELLALGAQYPDLQHKFWIYALGSTRRSFRDGFDKWYGSVLVPLLFTDWTWGTEIDGEESMCIGGRRIFSYHKVGSMTNRDFNNIRFLAVRK